MRSEPGRWHDEEGSVLLLMPSMVLVVVILGAIAVDAAVVYLGEREAANLAASVANDAAALVDEAGLYDQGRVCLDRTALVAYAEHRFAVASSGRFEVARGEGARTSRIRVVDPCLDVGGAPTIEATVVARVPLIVSRALPGPDEVVVDAVSQVRLAAR